MKIKIIIHKGDVFTTFLIDEICNIRTILGDMPIKEQINEVYKIIKLFAENGYNPQVYIKGE